MKKSESPLAAAAEKILQAKHILLMTHVRPDGDALGSVFGMCSFLRKNGFEADIVLPGTVPMRYMTLCKDHLTRVDDIDRYDLIIALDCANAERLGCGETLDPTGLSKRNFLCIDHHCGNVLDASAKWISPNAASTCQMVMEMIDHLGMPVDKYGATMLLIGMMTDTGCFCFSNTSGSCFRAAALAADAGADVELIANTVFFSKPLRQLQFETELVSEHMKMACRGKLAYACITEELLKKHDFELREDEGLIDILRGIRGVVIAMLVHRRADGWRISLRSKDSRFPVRPIALQFGGGGHDLAAGCTIDVPEFSDVENLLVPIIDKLLAGL